MTPKEREEFEREIYNEIVQSHNRGAITSAADYLRHKDNSRVSRIVSLNDSRTNNIFGEVSDLLEAFNHKHPDLEEFIWQKLSLRRNDYKKADSSEALKLNEVVYETSKEQLGMSYAVSRNASQDELETEAFKVMEQSKRQYEQIVGMRHIQGNVLTN